MAPLTHGHASGYEQTATYNSWRGMIQRCDNPKAVSYKNYGARGITYARRWRKFENFLADMGEAPDGMQLDRIKSNKNYTKRNCRWATRKQNRDTRRVSIYLTHGGETKLLTEWSDQLGIHYETLRCRVRAGWPAERVLTERVHRYG